jgi:hypothetical protein
MSTITTPAATVTHRLALPTVFYWDHSDRDLPSGKYLGSLVGLGLIECDQDTLEELLSDARYYASPHGPDQACIGLKSSARATVKRIEKYLAGRHQPR